MNPPDRQRRILLGVDPGTTATGLVLIDTGEPGPPPPVPSKCVLLARATLRPKGADRAGRLVDLGTLFRVKLNVWAGADALSPIGGNHPVMVIEDPTDYNPTAHGKRRSNTALVGAAFGILLGNGYRIMIDKGDLGELHAVPSQEWLPQTRSRNFVHPMKHKHARELLRRIFPFLADCTDDETFAGGVAMYWHLGGRVSL